MHSLEYIKQINDEAAKTVDECLKKIDETNDVETLKGWLRSVVIDRSRKTFCSNCGQHRG